ncbi:MAG: ferritin family protein [Deltaproteobacteria bacterium]|nr:ferritin family protein [Deltaproteobacteria bacterium]
MDRMSSIELAIKNEQSEMEFYLEQAKRTANPIARLLFHTLAQDEREHMTRVRGLHEKLTADGSWPDDVPIEVAGTNIQRALSEMTRVAAVTNIHEEGDIAALNQGVGFEAAGAKFYADLAGACDNPQERKFFEFLAGIEREHLLSIKDSIFYLEDPEGWLESHEHIGLDGG